MSRWHFLWLEPFFFEIVLPIFCKKNGPFRIRFLFLAHLSTYVNNYVAIDYRS